MQEDFESKYTKTNPLSERIINGFYRGLEQLTGQTEKERVLEVGCGAGFSTSRIRGFLNAPIQAIELENHLVEKAQQRNPGVLIQQGSAYELEFSDNEFDLVYILEVLEHLEDPEKALAEIKRVSKKWVIASVPREPLWCALNMARGKYWSSWGNTPGHIQNWSSRQFTKMLSDYGKVVSVRQPIPWTIVLLDITQ